MSTAARPEVSIFGSVAAVACAIVLAARRRFLAAVAVVGAASLLIFVFLVITGGVGLQMQPVELISES